MDAVKLKCDTCEVPGLYSSIHNRGLICKHCIEGFGFGVAAAAEAILKEKDTVNPDMTMPAQFGYWEGIKKAAQIAAGLKVDETAGVKE